MLKSLTIFSFLLAVATPLHAEGMESSPPPRPSTPASERSASSLRMQAELAERQGRWTHALDNYLQLHVEFGPSLELKERIRICLRQASRIRRYRDPHFQQFVVSLPTSDALNLYAEVLDKLSHVYTDPDRCRTESLFSHGLEELHRSLGDPQFIALYLEHASELRREQFRQSLRHLWRSRLPSSVREARQAARELVLASQAQLNLDKPSAFILELISGACQGLDEYTRYQNPTQLSPTTASLASLLEQYGVRVVFRGRHWQIDKILANSWAAVHTVLKPGDRLQKINGQPVERVTAEQLAVLIRNSPFAFDLEVESSSAMPVPVRLPVPVPTVYGVDMIHPKDGIGYLRISEFRESTPREIDDAILSLKVRGLRALIMDLRGNHGGLLTAGIEVTQQFLPSGIILTTRGQTEEFANRVFSSDSGMSAYDFPLAILIDSETMSAAEIVAMALKDHERAILIGMPSYGKGAIQATFLLQPMKVRSAETGTLIATVATMFGPRGAAIAAGVLPHYLETDPIRQLDMAVARVMELLPGYMPMMNSAVEPEHD